MGKNFVSDEQNAWNGNLALFTRYNRKTEDPSEVDFYMVKNFARLTLPWIRGSPTKKLTSVARPADGFLNLGRLGLVLEPLIQGRLTLTTNLIINVCHIKDLC